MKWNERKKLKEMKEIKWNVMKEMKWKNRNEMGKNEMKLSTAPYIAYPKCLNLLFL